MELYNYANKWTKINLKDYIVTIESGKRPKGGAVSEGIPSLGGEHIDSSGGFKIEFDRLKYVPTDFYGSMKSGIIKKGDILVVKDGATTGKVAYVGEEFPLDKACINEHVFLLRTNKELDGRYLSYFLRSSSGQRNIMNDFRIFDVALPPIELQNKFAAFVNQVDKLKFEMEKSLKELENNFNSLMQKAFKGELFN